MFLLGEDVPSNMQQPGELFASMLHSFCESLATAEAAWTWRPTDTERAALRDASKAIESAAAAVPFGLEAPELGLEEAPHVTWFPAYGCALVARVVRVGVVDLQLVGLDRFAFAVHSHSRGREHCALAGRDAAVALHVGIVSPETVKRNSVQRDAWDKLDTVGRYQRFMALTEKLLQAAKARTGDKRSAKSNAQGNQKTPSMIQAVMLDSLQGLSEAEDPEEGFTAPRGGFTDVGLHTGGTARNTTWPLVRGVLQIILEQQGQRALYRLAMPQLQLWLTERQLSLLTPETSTPKKIDTILQMMTAAVEECELLADEQVANMAAFQARCA